MARPTIRPPVHGLKAAFADVYQYRELLSAFTVRNIKIRYKQAVMGFGWAIFMPILIVLSGALIRFAMARSSGGTVKVSEIGGIALKGVAWAYFVSSLTLATTILTASYTLLTKIYFPRVVMPLAATVAQGLDLAIGLGAMLLLLPFMGAQFQWSLLWVPVLVLLLFLFTTAASVFLSCANVFFRDVKYIVQVVLTFGIFFTPVFYDPALIGARGAKVMSYNPLTGILEGFRVAVIEGHNLAHPLTVQVAGHSAVAWAPWWLGYSALWAVGGLLLSLFIFRRAQPLFAEYV